MELTTSLILKILPLPTTLSSVFFNVASFEFLNISKVFKGIGTLISSSPVFAILQSLTPGLTIDPGSLNTSKTEPLKGAVYVYFSSLFSIE